MENLSNNANETITTEHITPSIIKFGEHRHGKITILYFPGLRGKMNRQNSFYILCNVETLAQNGNTSHHIKSDLCILINDMQYNTIS